MLMPDGSIRPSPAYLSKPQSHWTQAEKEEHARLQQEVLEMEKLAQERGKRGP